MITINRLPKITTLNNRRVTSGPKMISPVPKRHLVMTRVSPDIVDSLNTGAYFVGKGIILFTMFYCSMNWVYYRGMRIDAEKEDEKKNKKKDK